jgi:hypothetical protein
LQQRADLIKIAPESGVIFGWTIPLLSADSGDRIYARGWTERFKWIPQALRFPVPKIQIENAFRVSFKRFQSVGILEIIMSVVYVYDSSALVQ